MNNENTIIVNPEIFKGKSEEEIIEICKKYLGECDVEHRFFPSALSRGPALFNYGDRLWSISRNIKNEYSPLDSATKRDLGVTGSPGLDIGYLAAKAINEEAIEISNRGIRGESRKDIIGKDEIERRTSLISTFASKEGIERFAGNSLYLWYYTTPLDEIESDFKENNASLVDSLKKDLPPFLQMVELLLAHNVEIDQIEMHPGYTILDVYNNVMQKFSKYFHEGKIIDQEDNISNMLEKQSEDRLSIEEIQKQIEENSKEIEKLTAKNEKLQKALENLTNSRTL